MIGRRITRGSIASGAAVLGLSSLFTATLFSQHPLRAFERLRDIVPVRELVPDWRFFAPEPGRHDFVVLARVRRDGEVSPWFGVHDVNERSLRQALWFPGHRIEKALFDVCMKLAIGLRHHDVDARQTESYRLLQGMVVRVVRARYPDAEGVQFVVAKDAGLDVDADTEYVIVSHFIRYDESAVV